MQRLKHRADFLAASSGLRASATTFVLLARRRDDDGPARMGFTVSRKVGNAVERNRVRRRLKEMVMLAATERVRPGHDYVLVARRPALTRAFDDLIGDFSGAVRRLAPGRKPAHRKGASGKSGPTSPQKTAQAPAPHRGPGGAETLLNTSATPSQRPAGTGKDTQ